MFYVLYNNHFFFVRIAFQSSQLQYFVLSELKPAEAEKHNYNNGMFASFASW